MKPEPSAVRIVGVSEEQIPRTKSAVLRAFPGVAVTVQAQMAEISPRISHYDEFWIVPEKTFTEFETRFSKGDGRGWNRPAIVAEGTANSWPEIRSVDIAVSSEPLLAEIFRAVFVENSLRRENRRLLGDLRTISSRIVHDLRSPLTPIFANVELLQMIMSDAKLHEEEVLSGIQNSADDLTRLIDRLSLITKNSTVSRTLEKVSLPKVIGAVREKLEGKLQRARAVVREATDLPEVIGAPAWLELIYLQWFENALRHAGPAPVIELGATSTSRGVRAFIRDRGPGVAADKAAKLFQPFDVHDLGAPRGLGLPLVHRLVEMQGGQTGYQRVEPQGSEFYLELPAA